MRPRIHANDKARRIFWRKKKFDLLVKKAELANNNRLKENKLIYKQYGFYENGELKLTEAGKKKLK